MNKECNYFQQMMQAGLDGTLAAGEKAAFEQHLAGCRACSAEFRTLQFSLELLRSLPVPEPGPGFTNETLKKARAAKQRQIRQQRFLSWIMVLVTLLASSAMVVGWLETVRPAIGRIMAAILYGCLELWALLSGLLNAAAALLATLLTLSNAVFPLSGQGWGLFFSELGIALAVMLSMAFMFKLRRFRAGAIVFSL